MDCKKCDCHFIITWLICEEDPKTIHCPNCGSPLTKPEPLSLEQELKRMEIEEEDIGEIMSIYERHLEKNGIHKPEREGEI